MENVCYIALYPSEGIYGPLRDLSNRIPPKALKTSFTSDFRKDKAYCNSRRPVHLTLHDSDIGLIPVSYLDEFIRRFALHVKERLQLTLRPAVSPGNVLILTPADHESTDYLNYLHYLLVQELGSKRAPFKPHVSLGSIKYGMNRFKIEKCLPTQVIFPVYELFLNYCGANIEYTRKYPTGKF